MLKIAMRNILKDDSAQGGVMSFFIGAMVAVVIALQVAWPVIDSTIYGESAASGVLTFNGGNISDAEYVNFTNGAAVYSLQFNLSGSSEAFPTGSIYVNLSSSDNKSSAAAVNLTTAINANATLAALLTATTVGNTTVIQYDTAGLSGNDILTSDGVANASWGATHLTGGANKATDNMSTASATLVEQLPLFLVLVLLMVFIKAII